MAYDKVTEEYDQNGKLTNTTKERQIRKTFWYWLQLLIIPAVLAAGAIVFSIKQNNDSLNLNNMQYTQSLHIAATRYVEDQHNALDQQQAAILQTYINNIQYLLLNHNLLKSSSIHTNNPYYDVAILARARTLTALQGLDLDSERKGSLLKFLYEAQLIGFPDNTGKPDAVIDLSGADLTNAALHDTDLIGVNLSNADLYGAMLYRSDLRNANLQGVDLRNANLQGVDLRNANLQGANLTGADLGCTKPGGQKIACVDLSSAIVTSEQLAKARSLKGATMPDGSTHP